MDREFNSYSIDAKTFEIFETFSDEYFKAKVLKDSNNIEIIFDGKDYSRLWGRAIDGDILARQMAEILASYEPEIVRNKDYSDDVRYAVYYDLDEGLFAAICLSDSEVQSYNKDNFVRGSSGIVEFYRRDYQCSNIDSEELVKALASKVCEVLNEVGIYE